jgi:hypothetical protein
LEACGGHAVAASGGEVEEVAQHQLEVRLLLSASRLQRARDRFVPDDRKGGAEVR